MHIVDGHTAVATLALRLREPAVAIGNFDGIHLGHQRLFAETRRRAEARGAHAVVLTFWPHPAKLLNAQLAPPLILTQERKLELIAAAGIDVCLVERFDRELAALSPRQFVDDVVVGALGAREVCVGYDFTFGKGRAGTVQVLAELGSTRGFTVDVLPPVAVGGLVCSSTKVREFLLEGRVEGAAILLGREPEVEGVVVPGAGRGRTIGVPTANLRPATELLPAPGVYAGWAERPGDAASRHLAAVNIGSNPTFGGGALTVEAHLLDYSGPSLMGERLRLGFRRRLRSEQKFPTVEALVAQIRSDIVATREGASRT